jgi:hypothetical protein
MYWGLPLAPPLLLGIPVGRLYRVVAEAPGPGATLVGVGVVAAFELVESLDAIMDYDMYKEGRIKQGGGRGRRVDTTEEVRVGY